MCVFVPVAGLLVPSPQEMVSVRGWFCGSVQVEVAMTERAVEVPTTVKVQEGGWFTVTIAVALLVVPAVLLTRTQYRVVVVRGEVVNVAAVAPATGEFGFGLAPWYH